MKMQFAITVCLLVVCRIAVAVHHDEFRDPQLLNQMKFKRSVMNGIPYAYGYHHVPIEPLMADNYERFAESHSDATAYSAYQPASKSFWSSSQLTGPSYAFQKPVAVPALSAPENRVNSDVVYRTLMQRAAAITGSRASAEAVQDRGGNVAIQLTANVVYDYERPTAVVRQSMTGYQPSDVAEPSGFPRELYDQAAKIAAGHKSAMFFTEDIVDAAPFLIVALGSGESSEEKNMATGATTATPAPTATAPSDNYIRGLFNEFYDAEAKTADMDRNTYTVITDDAVEAKTEDLPTESEKVMDMIVIVDRGESSESTSPAATEANPATDEVISASDEQLSQTTTPDDSFESFDSEPATTADPTYDEATLGPDFIVMVIKTEKQPDDQSYDTETNNIVGRPSDNEIASISSEEMTTQSPVTTPAVDAEEQDGHFSDEENVWDQTMYVAPQTEAPEPKEDIEDEEDKILLELRRRFLHDLNTSFNVPEETTTPEASEVIPTEIEQYTTSSSLDVMVESVDVGESEFEEELPSYQEI